MYREHATALTHEYRTPGNVQAGCEGTRVCPLAL